MMGGSHKGRLNPMIPGFVNCRVVASFLQGSAMRDESEFILGKKSCSMVEGAHKGKMGVGKSPKGQQAPRLSYSWGFYFCWEMIIGDYSYRVWELYIYI